MFKKWSKNIGKGEKGKKNKKKEAEPEVPRTLAEVLEDVVKEKSDVPKQEETELIEKVSEETPCTNNVMMSYSHVDTEMMNAIKGDEYEKLVSGDARIDIILVDRKQDFLTQNGLRVWVDVVGLEAGVDFLSKIGQAIVDSQTFITLLSEDSIKSKYCQDELALAYISNKPIFPVSIKPAKELVPLMDTGMRLQLAGMKWVVIDDMADFDVRAVKLLKRLYKRLDATLCERKDETVDDVPDSEQDPTEGPGRFKMVASHYRFYTRQTVDDDDEEEETEELDPKYKENPNQFWDRHFNDTLEISWKAFYDGLSAEFHDDLHTMCCEEDLPWLRNILYHEMEVEESDDMLDKTIYLNFCTVEDELLPLWKRVEDQARESYAMREVFDMKSSVRIQAIENLAKIKSAAVMDALRDLVEDTDPNVRAVAAISLAKTGNSDRLTIKKVLKTLNDSDRLVREAGCIALGRLKAVAAVPRLVDKWRNDVMSSVRNAAELALNQISGPEVEKAMHIIGILTHEIHMLTEGVNKE